MEGSDSDSDFDEEQYQNELNDAVDDGGGCAETWSALNQRRNNTIAEDSNKGKSLQNHDRGHSNDDILINRRKLVQSLGSAAGALAVGSSGIGSVSADSVDNPQDASNEQIERALSSAEVENLLDELNGLPIQRGKAQAIEVTMEMEDNDTKLQVELITLPTPAGEIVYGESNVGPTEASFLFGTSLSEQRDPFIPPGLKKQFPDKYKNLPSTGAKLTYANGDFLMARFPTETEKNEIANLIEAPVDDIRVSVNSADSAFRAVTAEGDVYLIDTGANNPAYQEVTGQEFQDATVEQILTAQGCASACATCIAALGGGCFFTCGVACLTVVTLVGVALCAACAVTFCATAPLICMECSLCA